MINIAIQILLFLLPWFMRRRLLNLFFGFKIAPSARIGFSVVLSRQLEMAAGSRIGHLNFCSSLTLLRLAEKSAIAHKNWISCTPEGPDVPFFKLDVDRHSALILGRSTNISSRHHIDCSGTITVGDFVTIAGWGSQFCTHGIDIRTNRQRSGTITIGDYCFVGTRSVLLKDSVLPDFSVLAAGSVLNKRHQDAYSLYSGVPATKVRELESSSLYFSRTVGDVT